MAVDSSEFSNVERGRQGHLQSTDSRYLHEKGNKKLPWKNGTRGDSWGRWQLTMKDAGGFAEVRFPCHSK